MSRKKVEKKVPQETGKLGRDKEETMDDLMGLVEQANSGGKVKSIDEIKAELNYEKEKFEKRIGKKPKSTGQSEGLSREMSKPEPEEDIDEPRNNKPIIIDKRPILIKEPKLPKTPSAGEMQECEAIKHKIRSLHMKFKKYDEVKLVQINNLDSLNLEKLQFKYEELRNACLGYSKGANLAQRAYVRVLDTTERLMVRFDPHVAGTTQFYLHPIDDETREAKEEIDRCLAVINHEVFGSFGESTNPYIRLGLASYNLMETTKMISMDKQKQLQIIEDQNKIFLRQQEIEKMRLQAQLQNSQPPKLTEEDIIIDMNPNVLKPKEIVETDIGKMIHDLSVQLDVPIDQPPKEGEKTGRSIEFMETIV